MRASSCLAALVIGSLRVAAAAPAAPPSEVARWTAQLADPRTSERAVTELEQLGDPAALDALAAAWRDRGHDPHVLHVIVAIARPQAGRKASWARVKPVLVAALRALDAADPRSVDNASVAADAIGEAQLAAALPDLATLARAPANKKTITAQVAAIRALGRLTGAADAGATLRALVERDPPSGPPDELTLHLMTTGAAINALGELRDDRARTSLILAAYRTPQLLQQIRRALVGLGPRTATELRSILRGEHAQVNALFQRLHLDRACDSDAPDHCNPVSAMDFYAAVMLGDQHDPAAVPELVAALARPALPTYYDGDRPSPLTQRNAIFDALRRLGVPASAEPVRAIWQAHATDAATRALALSTFAFVAHDDSALAELGELADDHDADDAVRVEAATAFARLAHDAPALAKLAALAKRYRDVGSRERTRADGQPRSDAGAADAMFATAKARADRAKAALAAIAADSGATAAQLRKATADATAAAAELVVATKSHRERTLSYSELDRAATDDLGFARTLQDDLARVELAIHCGEDLACYAAALDQTPAALASRLGPMIPDLATWRAEDLADLLAASRERALLELGKRGAKAAAFTDALLQHVATATPATRESLLLALPLIAPLPCPHCTAALDAVAADRGDASFAAVAFETDLLRRYYATR